MARAFRSPTVLARCARGVFTLSVFAHRVSAVPLVVGCAIVVGKVALSAPQLAGNEAFVAITWVVALAFVVVGLVLLATDLPPANGWACLLVAAATIPGDLNDPHYAASYLTPLGYVLEPLYLPATVALVLRYPRARLTRIERILVGGLIVATSGVRLTVVATSGSTPDGFYRPPAWQTFPIPGWWHDWVFLRVGEVATVVLLLFTAALLARRVFTAGGLTRQSLAPLAVIGAVCAIAASIDRMIWILNLSYLHWVPAALLRDLSAAAIPVALLADLLRQRAAAAAVSEHVLAASRSGDTSALQTALRNVLVDPTLSVAVARDNETWADAEGNPISVTAGPDRRTEIVTLDDGTPLVAITCDAKGVRDGGLLPIALTAVRLGAENIRLNADLLARMADLQESRARIVEASATERRRVERDLHDGAQQQFLAVAATLAKADFLKDDQVRDVVDDAQARLTVALRELRQLARGIHPAALSQGGLPAALPTLCTGSPNKVEMRVDADLSVRRPAPAQETAVYFFVAEGLANAARHAEGGQLRIDVRRDNDHLLAQVSDDGDGGARIVRGGGLAGLADRVEALGGRLTVHSDPCPDHPGDRGSTIAVALPAQSPAP